MPETLSLQEFDAIADGAANPDQGATGAGTPRMISASDQAGLDRYSLDELKSERAKEKDPTNQASLDREIARRKQTAAPRKMSLGDFENMAEKAQKVPAATPAAPTPPAKPTPAQQERTFKDQAVQLGHEVAAVGDMVLSLPAMAAGALGEIGMRLDLAKDGVSHKAAGQGAAEFRNYIIEKGSPSWFADAMTALAPEGTKKPDATLVSKASNWISEQIAAGGKFMEKKTGTAITEEDVSMAANAAMAALGVKGVGKIGPKLKAPEIEKPLAKTPIEGTEGLAPEAGPEAKTLEPPKSPREAIERPVKTARKARAFTDEEVESMHQKWVAYTSQLANQEASKVAVKENEAKPVLDPTVSEKGMPPIEETPPKEGEATPEPELNKQAGGVNTKLLTTMAGVGLGMAAGAYLDEDNPIIGAALGAIIAPKPISAVAEGVAKLGKSILEGDDRIRINDITEQHDLNIQRAARTVAQVQSKLAELVPKRKDREAIHNAIDQGTVGSLKGKQAEAAKIAQDFYAQVEKDAKAAGTLDEGRANYSTHIWREADKDTLQSIIDQKAGPSMSPNSKYNKERAFITMAEGKAAGFKPLTEDIGEIVGLYGNSMYRSIANAKMLSRLKQAQTYDGTPLVQKATTAPGNYQSINHPSLQGLRVHPDIMPSLKFMFEAQEPHAIMAGLTALNTAIKRNAVSFSLFHAKALSDAMLGAVNNPLQVAKVIGQASLPKIFGTNRYLKMLKEGGAGDLVDKAFRDGLKISFERAESVDADVGGGFYKGMQVLQDAADKVLPFGAGKAAVKTYVRINHAFDNFMWGRLHAGMKLEVYTAKKEALLTNNAKAGHPISEQAAGKMAATYANDVFGGLHWQRLAEGARTKWGRDLSLAMNSPRGRMATQLLMFAPDWTLSTARAFYKALPFTDPASRGRGLEGITSVFSAKTTADLYRQQLVRSALYYAAVGDALNVSMSGHHLWENKDGDWTMVELGDGRRMQLSKHFMEPFHWMRQPGQQALNKLGVIPKEAANQALGTEYLSSKGRMPPMKGGRLEHLGRNFVPIAGNQFNEGGVETGVAGFMGFPIYGKTKEQSRQEAADRRNKRFQDQLKNYRKLHGLDQ